MLVLEYLRGCRSWLSSKLLLEKLDNPLGYVLLISLAVGIAYVIPLIGLKFSILIPLLILAIPVIGFCFFNQAIGIGVVLIVAFLIGLLSKYAELPFGISLDALLFLLFFGLLIQQVQERNMNFAKSPISILILIWVFYNLTQVLNPWAGSRMAWLFTVRSMAGLILLYFIACFAFKNARIIFNTIKLILALVFISALYGLKQEFFGFSDAELIWLYSDPERIQLIHQWSRLRIFSFFSDPTNFGILLSYSSTFCVILMTGPFNIWKKGILGFATICMIMAMGYAGSRTPFVLVPFGVVIFTLLTLKRDIIIGMCVFLFIGVGFVMKSTNSAVMYRVQSAFLLNKSDDTMNVRLENQRMIQPFIQSHPIGGGLGSTGIWGARFTPDTLLSSFAHDSGFVRVAVELGWIGLIIYCVFLFMVLKTSIYHYLRVKNPKIKVIYLGLTTVFFQLTLANYPQEAMTILPTSIIFYVLLAAMVKLKDYDDVVLSDDPNILISGEMPTPSVTGIPIDSQQTTGRKQAEI